MDDIKELRRLVVVGYGLAVRRVKKKVGCVRATHFPVVEIVGASPSPLRVVDIAPLLCLTHCSCLQRLRRVCDAGLIYKERKIYKLTDKGFRVFQELEKEFAVEMKRITEILEMQRMRR